MCKSLPLHDIKTCWLLQQQLIENGRKPHASHSDIQGSSCHQAGCVGMRCSDQVGIQLIPEWGDCSQVRCRRRKITERINSYMISYEIACPSGTIFFSRCNVLKNYLLEMKGSLWLIFDILQVTILLLIFPWMTIRPTRTITRGHISNRLRQLILILFPKMNFLYY